MAGDSQKGRDGPDCGLHELSKRKQNERGRASLELFTKNAERLPPKHGERDHREAGAKHRKLRLPS